MSEEEKEQTGEKEKKEKYNTRSVPDSGQCAPQDSQGTTCPSVKPMRVIRKRKLRKPTRVIRKRKLRKQMKGKGRSWGSDGDPAELGLLAEGK